MGSLADWAYGLAEASVEIEKRDRQNMIEAVRVIDFTRHSPFADVIETIKQQLILGRG
jgi:4-hydroxy-L-threonine phosphate dehydrogenase PdxA